MPKEVVILASQEELNWDYLFLKVYLKKMAVQYGLKIIPEIRKAIHELSEFIKDYLRENRTFILNYFMKIKDKVNAEELRFY